MPGSRGGLLYQEEAEGLFVGASPVMCEWMVCASGEEAGGQETGQPGKVSRASLALNPVT